jgi:hypothetical protein
VFRDAAQQGYAFRCGVVVMYGKNYTIYLRTGSFAS